MGLSLKSFTSPFVSAYHDVKDSLVDAYHGALDTVSSAASSIAGAGKYVLKEAEDGLQYVVNDVGDVIRDPDIIDAVKQAGSAVKDVAQQTSGVLQSVGSAAKDVAGMGVGTVVDTASSLKDIASGVTNAAKDATSTAAEAVKDGISNVKDIVQHPVSSIEAGAGAIASGVKDVAETATDLYHETKDNTVSLYQHTLNDISTGYQDTKDNLTSLYQHTKDDLVTGYHDTKDNFTSLYQHTKDDLVDMYHEVSNRVDLGGLIPNMGGGGGGGSGSGGFEGGGAFGLPSGVPSLTNPSYQDPLDKIAQAQAESLTRGRSSTWLTGGAGVDESIFAGGPTLGGYQNQKGANEVWDPDYNPNPAPVATPRPTETRGMRAGSSTSAMMGVPSTSFLRGEDTTSSMLNPVASSSTDTKKYDPTGAAASVAAGALSMFGGGSKGGVFGTVSHSWSNPNPAAFDPNQETIDSKEFMSRLLGVFKV